jgi:hypothetical protein
MGTRRRFGRPPRIRGTPGHQQDNLAALGRVGQPLFSAAAAIARQNHHAHQCCLGIGRKCHQGWSGLPLGSRASIWPAPPPHDGSPGVFNSCPRHGSLAPRSDKLFRFDGPFPPPRHSDLDHSHVFIEAPITFPTGYLDEKTELRGGSKEDRLAAQEWISLFWHEAVVREVPSAIRREFDRQ